MDGEALKQHRRKYASFVPPEQPQLAAGPVSRRTLENVSRVERGLGGGVVAAPTATADFFFFFWLLLVVWVVLADPRLCLLLTHPRLGRVT